MGPQGVAPASALGVPALALGLAAVAQALGVGPEVAVEATSSHSRQAISRALWPPITVHLSCTVCTFLHGQTVIFPAGLLAQKQFACKCCGFLLWSLIIASLKWFMSVNTTECIFAHGQTSTLHI